MTWPADPFVYRCTPGPDLDPPDAFAPVNVEVYAPSRRRAEVTLKILAWFAAHAARHRS